MKDLLGDEEAHPANPPAAWLGGKRQLGKRLVKRIGAIPHKTYVEPFVGMGGVFFRRTHKPNSEVINDINGELVNLFRILQLHYPQFMDCLKYQIASRTEFERLKGLNPNRLTDLQRAARFLYLQRLAFGGKAHNSTFGASPGTASRFNVIKLAENLADVHERLASVTIENLPWAEVIGTYDSPETLFYLDPPYWNGENDYGTGIFSKADFSRMARLLAEIKGHFLLSINDVPEIRKIFEAFDIEPVELTYSISNAGATNAKELIISK